jgi:hypothetical protein
VQLPGHPQAVLVGPPAPFLLGPLAPHPGRPADPERHPEQRCPGQQEPGKLAGHLVVEPPAASHPTVAAAVTASTDPGARRRNTTAADATSSSPQPSAPGSRLVGWLSTAPRVPTTPKAANPAASSASSAHGGRPAQIGNRADPSIPGSVALLPGAVILPGAYAPC